MNEQDEKLKEEDNQEDIVVEEEVKETNLEKEYLLKLAELENSKKRLEKQYQSSLRYANEKVILNFIEILDNLERAFKHSTSNSESIIKGIEMIISQFRETLSKEGIKEITLETFDPEHHHAVSYEESSEEEGKILEEIRKGYKLKEKVIRPTLVKIAKNKNEQLGEKLCQK